MAHHPVRQRPGQPQPLPTERKIRRASLRSRHVAGHADGLEAAIQHERMHVEPVSGHGFRQRHLGHRLPRTGPCPPQRAERRAEIDPRARAVAVVVRHLYGREVRPQALEIDAAAVFRVRNADRQTALHVDRPDAPAPPAEDLDAARLRRVGRIEHDLQGPPRRIRLVLVLIENERVVQLHLLHDYRLTLLLLEEGRRDRHGPVKRARRHDAAEHAVVVHPRRIRGEHVRLEGDVAAGRLVAGAQQRVAGAPATAFRGGEPVADAAGRGSSGARSVGASPRRRARRSESGGPPRTPRQPPPGSRPRSRTRGRSPGAR